MKDKKFEKRKQQLIQAIEEAPEDLENHLILAKFYFINQHYKESIEVYKKLLQYHQNNITVLYNLAVAYHADKQLEKAKEIYLSILKLKPDHKESIEGLEKVTTFK